MYEELFDFSQPVSSIIETLKKKTVDVTPWSKLVELYDPKKHKIVNDKIGRRDKKRSDGTIETASRIPLGLEKMLTKRFSQFTFAIPVKRTYLNTEGSEVRQQIASAIEKIYTNAHIDTENIKRGKFYYGACEFFTVWYAVEKDNDLYGFPCKYKLKCKTFSPMNGVSLYPLFDEYDDMIAMSFEYSRTVDSESVTFFETYTADHHYKWVQKNSEWEEVTNDEITLLKIPGVYMWTQKPCYEDLEVIREELEYTLSRNSDTISYNSAPILAVTGGLQGEEAKGTSRRVYRVENGGDVKYVSWNQSTESLKYQVEMNLKLFFMQAQMPDISFDAMKQLGNIGYDARQTLLMDAHLRIGDEKGNWEEAFEREANVIKAFLKMMNVAWEKEIDNVIIEHTITPFIQNDKKADLGIIQSATGGKAVMSQLDGIRAWGYSSNPEETYERIKEEEIANIPTFIESAI